MTPTANDDSANTADTLPIGLDESLPCPLCGYDLRGLRSSRCPECGHAFDLDAIRASRLNRSNWIFETAPSSRWAAVLRTSFRSLLPLSPAGFWHRFPASTPVVMPRLIRFGVYWFMAMLLWSTALCSWLAYARYTAAHTPLGFNRNFVTGTPTYRTWGRSQYTAADAIGDTVSIHSFLFELIVIASVLLSFAAINLFGLTLKRAGIHRGHLWRVAIYPLPLLILTTSALRAGFFLTGNGMSNDEAFKMLLAMAGVTLLHLVGAHLDYLRLPQAFIQAVLVWIVVWLAILCGLQFVYV